MKTIYPTPLRHFVSAVASVGLCQRWLVLLLVAAASLSASTSTAQSGGIFEGYAFLTVNGSFNTYHLQTNTGGTQLNGANLGTFCSARNSIVFNGGENKTFKCNGCDITGGNIFYRVYPQGSSTPPGFTSLSLPFAANISGAGFGCQNQQWRRDNGSQNILAGLGNGTYTLEVFTNATNAGCNSGTYFYSNLGQNFRATFSVNNNPNSGLFESYAVLNIKGAGNSFYDLNATTNLPELEGANLGSFFTNESLVIAGGENKTFKCGLDNITGSRLRYRVYSSGSPVGAFVAVNLPFASNDAGGGQGCQNQTWRSTTGTANVIAGLQPGNYTLEVYSESDYTSCVDGTHFANRSGSNYRATFTVQGLPVNCVLSAWSAWSPWSTDACGETATRTRTRTVITPAANGGAECGPLTETETRQNAPCPVDCVLSDWSDWSPWSTDACGETATRTRTRTVITPAANGGAECGPLTETETRTNVPCPVDCVLSDWSDWSPWSAACGEASRTRTRTVVTPAANGGAACGPLQETETRNIEPTVLTSTVTNCGPYTWSVNGSVYSSSGQYTVVSGCTTYVLNLTIASSTPIITAGVPANVVYRAIEARWKGFNNTSGVNTALYLGNNNMGSGGTNRVEVGRNGLYLKPGETPVSFVYSRAGNLLTASVGSRSVTYTNVSARATGNMGVLNFMQIMLRTGSGSNTGVAEFRNVVLNGQPLGNFVSPAASLLNWTVTNVDFSEGFVLTGSIRLDAGTYGSNEGSKLDIWVGHNNSPLPCTNTAAPIALRAEAAAQAKAAMQQPEATEAPMLDAEVLNNPATGNESFQLRIKAAPKAAVQMRVVDAGGRPVESRQQLRNNEVVRFGSSYRAGMYLIELQDGQQRKVLKVLKQ